ncbi:MAG: hypothetical protein KJ698_00390 [Actinobacteria bacterium]|nr:hypothetical protein [Actinomycetota bacterium]MBU1492893.1 hypothetical protein [Actinomycetota bacterium]
MGPHRLTTDGTTRPGTEFRGGVCRVVCGALTAGVCLHLFAAIAAVALAVSMIVIAVGGPAASWIGGIVIGSLATAIAMCAARHRT